jgi:cation-transporting P-type ATPase C
MVTAHLLFLDKINYVSLKRKNIMLPGDIKVRHSIRGRLRVKVVLLHLHLESVPHLGQLLAGQTGVKNAEVRPVTGSIILYYDPEKTTPRVLVKLLPEILTASLQAISASPVKKASQRVVNENSLFGSLLHVAALTIYSAYALVRSLIFKSPLPQGPLSLTGIVASVGSLPLLGHAWRDMRNRRGISLYPFLAGTCVLAIFMGEAITALEVVWVTSVSILLERYVADRSRRAIREALQVSTRNAYVLVKGREREIPVEALHEGDTVVVHTSEKIPADGVVIRGEALVDEAHITGRAELEHRKKNHPVYAGTIVQQGLIYFRAEKVREKTYLNRILQMVEESLANRAPAEKTADLLAARLVYWGIAATLGTLVLTGNFIRALTVLLVVSCPCASALAASTAVSATMANAARRRIFVKGGHYLENVGKADCFCFDKTGTITTGAPQVVTVVPRTRNQDPGKVLALAATAEIHNTHPLARAIVEEAKTRGISFPMHAVCEFILGRGVRATLDEESILVGNNRFMEDCGVGTSFLGKKAKGLSEAGHTVVYVARNGKLQGMIGITNTVRPGTANVLNWLRQDGVSSMFLITGDIEPVARTTARDLGFDEFRAMLLPEDKARYVEELAAVGRRVVVVGDGVNDALAISRAEIGVAMGAGGAEVAIEAADIALADSDIRHLVALRQMSRKTLQVIEQNHWLAVSTNAVGIVLGATGKITPIMGGLLHIIHTLGIMLNSSRLLRWEAPGMKEWTEPKSVGH